MKSKLRNEIETLNLHTFHMMIIKLLLKFKTQLKNAYITDKWWKEVLILIKKCELKQITANEFSTLNTELNFWFYCKENLVYYVDDSNERICLCISKALEKKIFKITYDNNHHAGFSQTYHCITEFLYFWKLLQHLKRYIKHCLMCQLNSTKHHTSYDKLMSILTTSISFHTVMMNFILTLSIFILSLNTLLIITDKYSK